MPIPIRWGRAIRRAAYAAGLKPQRVGESVTVSVEGYWARARLEPPSVQILVVVANTPEGSWRTEVEKGFM